MKLLCFISIVILPCSALGAAAPFSHSGKLHSLDEKALRGLRGGRQVSKSPQSSIDHSLRQQPIIALQASQWTHLHKAHKVKAGVRKRKLKRSTKTSRTLRQHLSKMHHRMKRGLKRMFKMHSEKHIQTGAVGACKNKLTWWIKVKKKCTKAYGKGSRWDKGKQGGKCKDAWNSCSTGFYAICCTQPLGPKNMEAYCANQKMTAEGDEKADHLIPNTRT